MSAQIVFKVNTDVSEREIKTELAKRWSGEYVEVTRTSGDGPGQRELLCDISYMFGREKEKEEVLAIVLYLQNVSVDGQLLYFRCKDTMDDSRLSDATLEAAQIFSKEYAPTMKWVPFHYRIEKIASKG